MLLQDKSTTVTLGNKAYWKTSHYKSSLTLVAGNYLTDILTKKQKWEQTTAEYGECKTTVCFEAAE